MPTIKEQIEDKRAELEELERQERLEKKQEDEDRMREFRSVAIKAHGVFCAWNHTDGCGWEYEVRGKDGPDNPNFEERIGRRGERTWQSAHHRWLEKVVGIAEKTNMTAQEIEAAIDAFAAAKKTMKPGTFFTFLNTIRNL